MGWKWLIGGAILLGLLALGYWFYASGRKPALHTVEQDSIRVFGRWYKGRQDSKKLQALYIQMDSLAIQQGGIPTSLFFDDPVETKAGDSTNAFVGFTGGSGDGILDTFLVDNANWIRAEIRKNGFGIPYRIYEHMQEYAARENLKIGDVSMERYFGDSLMIIDWTVE